ncbi:XRE family transcriptional regulator [Xanthomonas arboricola]|uniref:ImmA/IrrE family metallo-endopeptidase n=1 Tax=Xanthomonas arboricola TaxID=56448 RepID=UPI002B1ED382|nr:XRE family transcriptional regulator [Xanthomonas arboricola]MEA5150948.1 XRE family transcriptional regulator [Xanthomonas arboricola]CAD7384824.1 ImmA/IrrE family metallo-endopeptidase [Xanthomonas arboricola]
MTTIAPVSDPAKTLGARIAAARRAAALSQEQSTKLLGFADRQTLSALENGERRVQPAELDKMSQVFGKSVDWFLDPFVIAGEGSFSWRVSPSLPQDELDVFEEKAGKWIGLLRFLRMSSGDHSRLLAHNLEVDADMSFKEVCEMGEGIGQMLDLGPVPAERLVERIEERLGIPVLYFDGQSGGDGDVSGAMCRMRNFRAILINRLEPRVRRSFDAAHELFHALTWNALPPERQESSVPADATTKISGSEKKAQRIERLADNFAAGLLMPRESLEKAVEANRSDNIDHLADVAHLLQVSYSSLAFRLLNAGMISRATCDVLKVRGGVRPPDSRPKLFSETFVKLIASGIEDGHVSARRAAGALGMTLPQLVQLFGDYAINPPFNV